MSDSLFCHSNWWLADKDILGLNEPVLFLTSWPGSGVELQGGQSWGIVSPFPPIDSHVVNYSNVYYYRFFSGYFLFLFLFPARWLVIGYKVCCLVSNTEKPTCRFAATEWWLKLQLQLRLVLRYYPHLNCM